MSINNATRLPTRDEIAFPCLDGLHAIEHFHGKTLEQVEALFAEGFSLHYAEDLLWMEPVGFRFYFQAAIRYALSEKAVGDSDIINCLAGTLAHWQEFHPTELVPCARLLADFCRAVWQQFDQYDADPDIYGDLCEQYQQLAEVFERTADETGIV